MTLRARLDALAAQLGGASVDAREWWRERIEDARGHAPRDPKSWSGRGACPLLELGLRHAHLVDVLARLLGEVDLEEPTDQTEMLLAGAIARLGRGNVEAGRRAVALARRIRLAGHRHLLAGAYREAALLRGLDEVSKREDFTAATVRLAELHAPIAARKRAEDAADRMTTPERRAHLAALLRKHAPADVAADEDLFHEWLCRALGVPVFEYGRGRPAPAGGDTFDAARELAEGRLR